MSQVSINRDYFYLSSASSKHEKNQDSFGTWQRGKFNFMILCDGMGGLAKGELASNTIVRSFESWFLNDFDVSNFSVEAIEAAWRSLLSDVNNRIFAYGKKHRMNLGSTFVAVLILDDQSLCVSHVGDSRAYVLSQGALSQVTEDHTVLQRDLNAGRIRIEDADLHPQKHVLLQAVGTHEKFNPSFDFLRCDWSRVVLCSDGFYNRLTLSEIASFSVSTETLDSAVTTLRDRGEDDDISIIVMEKKGTV